MNGLYFAEMDENGREQPTYTLPGVLHFIKHEWAKFERERATWDSERAEFQAKIAFLQGERRGQENLKRDLVRRIKMLEYALKQERAKNYELKYGSKLTFSDMVPPELEKPTKDSEPVAIAGQRDSKNILKYYLKEIGYPDYVLDTRVSRLKALRTLGIQPTHGREEGREEFHKPNPPKRVDSYEKLLNIISSPQGHSPPVEDTSTRMPVQSESGVPVSSPTQKQEKPSEQDKLSLDVQEAFSELDQVLNDEDDSDSSDEGSSADDELESPETGFDDDQMEDEPAEEFTFSHGPHSGDSSSGVEPDKSSDSGPDVPLMNRSSKGSKSSKGDKKVSKRPSRRQMKDLEKELSGRGDEWSFGLPGQGGGGMGLLPGGPHVSIGPLEWIGDPDNEVPTNDTGKKWVAKYTMRSHLDAVTCVAFHPTESLLVTGSEDWTLKVWSLQQSKKSVLVDGEPVHTLRGHTGSILSIALGNEGDICFSAGVDCGIRCWQLPIDGEPFDEYDPSIHKTILVGHGDSVWDLSVHPRSGILLSCSADGTCCLWNRDLSNPLISTIAANQDLGIPTSCDFMHHDLRQMVVSYNTAQTVVYDIETGQVVTKLNSAISYDNTLKTQINKVCAHPTLPIVVTGHEDKYIRFFDSTSGVMKHEMIAHMDSVSGLAIDPNGLYLLSASHDGSLRFWNAESHICIQEISAHRKRYEEAVFNVACHSTDSMFASAGADSVAKVFV